MNFATHENSGESKAIELPRVDLVLLAIKDEELHVLLRRRDGREFFGELALPGGIIEVESDASLDHTVQRVARRLLQRQLPNFRQVTTIGNANRDPRKKWSLTVVYQSLVRSDFVFPDQMAAKQLSWHPVEKIRAGEKLNLDHKDLICLATDQAIRHHRHEIESLRFPNGWVPREFTLVELHGMCQAMMDKRLDMLTFRRRMVAAGLAQPIEGKFRARGAHRPAQIYTLIQSLPILGTSAQPNQE